MKHNEHLTKDTQHKNKGKNEYNDQMTSQRENKKQQQNEGKTKKKSHQTIG